MSHYSGDVVTDAIDRALPDDYQDNGLAGASPCHYAGQRLHCQSITKLGVDVFIAGPPTPDDCEELDHEVPFGSLDAVEDAVESGEISEARGWLYKLGTTDPAGHGQMCHYWTDFVPEACHFCHADLDRLVGSHIEKHGLDDVGVVTCPNCERIFGEY